MELGDRVSYMAVRAGTPVYSADGQQIGKVAHVLADEGEDVFDGIVIGEHMLGRHHCFADADEIGDIFEDGVVLKLNKTAAEQLPRPTANPGVIRDDPAESKGDFRREKLARAWDLISGNY